MAYSQKNCTQAHTNSLSLSLCQCRDFYQLQTSSLSQFFLCFKIALTPSYQFFYINAQCSVSVVYKNNFLNIQNINCSVFIHNCLTLHLSSAGRKTFPRARRTQVHGFRSPVSFSPTEQSPSTSSGSSVFTPDLEEVPGPARRPRRGSDIEPNPTVAPTLSVMDISPPSRCESLTLITCFKNLTLFWGVYLFVFVTGLQLHVLQPTGG